MWKTSTSVCFIVCMKSAANRLAGTVVSHVVRSEEKLESLQSKRDSAVAK